MVQHIEARRVVNMQFAADCHEMGPHFLGASCKENDSKQDAPHRHFLGNLVPYIIRLVKDLDGIVALKGFRTLDLLNDPRFGPHKIDCAQPVAGSYGPNSVVTSQSQVYCMFYNIDSMQRILYRPGRDAVQPVAKFQEIIDAISSDHLKVYWTFFASQSGEQRFYTIRNLLLI